MATIPPMKVGQRFELGSEYPPRIAIVSRVHRLPEWADRIEVVYLDNKGLAVAEDMRWDGSQWVFVHDGPCAAYADNSNRLKRHAEALYAERSQLRRDPFRSNKRIPRKGRI